MSGIGNIIDTDGDGKISKEEFMAVGRQYGHTEEDFDIVDTDKSGYLDAQEIQDFSELRLYRTLT